MLGNAIECYTLKGGDTLLKIVSGDDCDEDDLRGFRKLTADDLLGLKKDIDQLVRSSKNHGT